MCPACIATAATIATGATSAGGLAAFLLFTLRGRLTSAPAGPPGSTTTSAGDDHESAPSRDAR